MISIEACPKYGGVIHGVKGGPSPDWLSKRLNAIGVKSVNNVVDITNYVMFECGQPLHAFDLSKISGGASKAKQIHIRPAKQGETFVAIDHKSYSLDPTVVVIADQQQVLALGGVMGGQDSEVSDSTTDLLIEAASFTPLSVRQTARRLKLQSPSSYRFERKVDAMGLQWASDRCCQLIVEIAGGIVAKGSVQTGFPINPQDAISFRLSKVARVLGIDIPVERSIAILQALGCAVVVDLVGLKSDSVVQVTPPSFRSDLLREIDLIEEIARIHGYDAIPEDAMVPIFVSTKRPKDIMIDRVRNVMTSAGFDESLTPSVVNKQLANLISPWTDLPSLTTKVQLLDGATLLRKSLVPSLIQGHLLNQSQQNRDACLFETAKVYLPSADQKGLPTEQMTLGWCGPRTLEESIGIIEELIERVAGTQTTWSVVHSSWPAIAEHTGAWIELNNSVGSMRIGWCGILSKAARDGFKIDSNLTVGEVNLEALLSKLEIIPTLSPLPMYPAIHRDLNLIVDESLRWNTLEEVVKKVGGPLLNACRYQETYRDAKRDGIGRKRLLMTLVIQSNDQTLTGSQADEVVKSILKATSEAFNAAVVA